MNFNTYIDSCNHHHNSGTELFHYPKNFPPAITMPSHSPSISIPWKFDLFSIIIVLLLSFKDVI